MMQTSDFEAARARMVKEQLKSRGISQEAVLEAMKAVPREAFVDEKYGRRAYLDGPLPIGEGQTISQPYVVAMMAEALAVGPEDRVLDIGTGSGYAAAVLSRIAAEVYTVERLAPLVDRARRICQKLGYQNIHFRQADGTLGLADQAPFDAINVAAAGPEVPGAIREQLAPGGRLVMPVGEQGGIQRMLRVTRAGDHERPTRSNEFKEEQLAEVRFVPLLGRHGFDPQAGGEPS